MLLMADRVDVRKFGKIVEFNLIVFQLLTITHKLTPYVLLSYLKSMISYIISTKKERLYYHVNLIV